MAKKRKAGKQQKQQKQRTQRKERVQRNAQRKLDQTEQNVLWCLHLGAQSIGKIAGSINLPTDQVREALDSMESMYLVQKKGFMGQYTITQDGLKHIEPRELKLDTKVANSNVRHGQETTLWITARNSGGAPLSNAWIRIVSPEFVDVRRYNAEYTNDGGRNVVEFPLTQLHPGEVQSVNFKVRGSLTQGAVSSTYKVEVSALTDEKETDRKEINLMVVQ